MRGILNINRVHRLIKSAIEDLGLDLRGICVLTEAASGPFAITPVLAAMAGAESVIAVGRDSRWGYFRDVVGQIEHLAQEFKCHDVIRFSDLPAYEHSARVNLVTNLGFVRPIDRRLIDSLPSDSAVALMWEPWEFRESEIDVKACYKRGIPVLGTNEQYPRLRIFEYLPRVIERLLFELDIEVTFSKLVLIASPPFGTKIFEGLSRSGAEVDWIDPLVNETWKDRIESNMDKLDAIVVAEHRSEDCFVGNAGISPELFLEHGVELIHLCGNLDYASVGRTGLVKHPSVQTPHGVMTVTTDFVGPRPVIDLHAAGLAIGGKLIQCIREGMSRIEAENYVVESGLGARIPDQHTN
jgi:hypothetical protein